MLATLLLGGLILGPAKGVVVVDMLAIGRLENGRWYTAKAEPNDPVGKTGAAKYYPLSMSGIGAPISLPKLRFDEEVAPGWYIEYVEKAASTALWTGTPAKAAKVVKYSPTSKTYVDVVKAHLQAKGLKNSKPRINAVYGVDLDGDGTREILIEAAPKADMRGTTMGENPNKADYTSILVRYVSGSKVVTTTQRAVISRMPTNCEDWPISMAMVFWRSLPVPTTMRAPAPPSGTSRRASSSSLLKTAPASSLGRDKRGRGSSPEDLRPLWATP